MYVVGGFTKDPFFTSSLPGRQMCRCFASSCFSSFLVSWTHFPRVDRFSDVLLFIFPDLLNPPPALCGPLSPFVIVFWNIKQMYLSVLLFVSTKYQSIKYLIYMLAQCSLYSSQLYWLCGTVCWLCRPTFWSNVTWAIPCTLYPSSVPSCNFSHLPDTSLVLFFTLTT